MLAANSNQLTLLRENYDVEKPSVYSDTNFSANSPSPLELLADWQRITMHRPCH